MVPENWFCVSNPKPCRMTGTLTLLEVLGSVLSTGQFGALLAQSGHVY